jgi:putative SOS response-associated peptidase YedK
MCGRFSFVAEDALILERFGIRVRTAIYKARYNCAPGQNLAVIAGDAPDTLNFFRWGLIPSWAKDASIGNKLIDARGETLTEKPSFRNAFKNRRCLVPATGFFEWKRNGSSGTKSRTPTPWNIRMKNGDPFCFAGIWDKWVTADGEIIQSFAIVTTSPNKLTEQIHDRMPVILHQDDEQRWISPQPDPSLVKLLKPFPEELMEAWPVSTLVNSPGNDVPGMMDRVDEWSSNLLF